MNLKEPVEREEFILLNQPAITIRGELSNGQYILFAQTILDGNVLELGSLGQVKKR